MTKRFSNWREALAAGLLVLAIVAGCGVRDAAAQGGTQNIGQSIYSNTPAKTAATVLQVDPITGVSWRPPGGPYVLLANAGTGTGTPAVNLPAGSYEWCVQGTVGGSTIALKVLGPDGVNYMQIASVTAAGCTGVVVGMNATVEVTVTGGTPSALYSNLS